MECGIREGGHKRVSFSASSLSAWVVSWFEHAAEVVEQFSCEPARDTHLLDFFSLKIHRFTQLTPRDNVQMQKLQLLTRLALANSILR